MRMRAPDRLLQFVEDEDHREGEQHLLQVIALIEMADEQPLDRETEEKRERDTDDERTENVAERLRQRQRRVRAEHVERAVRQIDDPENAEDERPPAGW